VSTGRKTRVFENSLLKRFRRFANVEMPLLVRVAVAGEGGSALPPQLSERVGDLTALGLKVGPRSFNSFQCLKKYVTHS